MVNNTDKIIERSTRENAILNNDIYFGTTFQDESTNEYKTNQITTAIREVIDNSVQEIVYGLKKEGDIWITLDGSDTKPHVIVEDTGRGLPIKTQKGVKGIEKNGINMALGSINSSGNYENKVLGRNSKNGVGASVSVAISSLAKVSVKNGDKLYGMWYQKGIPGYFKNMTQAQIKTLPDYTKEEVINDLKVKEHKASVSSIFNYSNDFKTVDTNIFNSAHLVDNQKFILYNDNELTEFSFKDTITENNTKAPDVNHGTIVELWFAPRNDMFIIVDKIVEQIKSACTINPKLRCHLNIINGPSIIAYNYKNNNYDFESNPKGFDGWARENLPDAENGIQKIIGDGSVKDNTGDTNDFTFELFLTMSADNPKHYGWVNSVQSLEGSSYENAIYNSFAKKFNCSVNIIKKCLNYAINLKITTATYTSQAKEIWRDYTVTRNMQQVIEAASNRLASQTNRKIVAIYKAEETRLKASIEDQKQVKEIKETTFVPENYYAPGHKKELFIVEGFSAASSLTKTRNASTQGILALRGVPISPYRYNPDVIIKNTEVRSMVAIFDAGYRDSFDVNKVEFDHIIITADADIDGYHINTMVMTLFNFAFPGLLESGKVYISRSPLLKVKDSNGNIKYRGFGEKVQNGDKILERYKGLGSLSGKTARETIMDPKTRIVDQIIVDKDFGEALETWMGSSKGADSVIDEIAED